MSKPTAVAPFVRKLYEIVNDPATDEIVHWFVPPKAQQTGEAAHQSSPPVSCFVVDKFEDFTTHCLPKLSKSSSFCSFVRQLNGYGFSKADTKRAAFGHSLFQKGNPDLLPRIKRRQSAKRRSNGARAGREYEGKAAHAEAATSTARPARPRFVARRIAPVAASKVDEVGDAGRSQKARTAGYSSTDATPKVATGWQNRSSHEVLLMDALSTIKAIVLANETAKHSPEAAAGVAAQVRNHVEMFAQRQAPGMFFAVQSGSIPLTKVVDHLMTSVYAATMTGSTAAPPAATATATAHAPAAAPALGGVAPVAGPSAFDSAAMFSMPAPATVVSGPALDDSVLPGIDEYDDLVKGEGGSALPADKTVSAEADWASLLNAPLLYDDDDAALEAMLG